VLGAQRSLHEEPRGQRVGVAQLDLYRREPVASGRDYIDAGTVPPPEHRRRTGR
jgi:hypothetical protein